MCNVTFKLQWEHLTRYINEGTDLYMLCLFGQQRRTVSTSVSSPPPGRAHCPRQAARSRYTIPCDVRRPTAPANALSPRTHPARPPSSPVCVHIPELRRGSRRVRAKRQDGGACSSMGHTSLARRPRARTVECGCARRFSSLHCVCTVLS